MSELTSTLSEYEIHKGLHLLGLNLSDLELQELQMSNIFLLENRSLSEIGSVFILAAAMATLNLGNPKKAITFRDLPLAATDSAHCAGIPIYYWNSDALAQSCSCLYLTLVDGKPALRIDNNLKK